MRRHSGKLAMVSAIQRPSVPKKVKTSSEQITRLQNGELMLSFAGVTVERREYRAHRCVRDELLAGAMSRS